jgi:hypothetical protein
MEQEKYIFKYNGNLNGIDINTLVTSQFHFSAIITEIKNQLYPEANLKIKIQSFKDGSFEVHQIVEAIAIGFFSLQGLGVIENTFSIIGNILNIKTFLKDNKADQVIPKDNTHVEIHFHGNHITVAKDAFKIYQNNHIVNNALGANGRLLDNDEEIEGFELIDKDDNNVVFKVEREDFSSLYASNPYLDDVISEDIKQTVIHILRWETMPNKNSKWSFIHNKRKISNVIIRDEEFLQKVAKQKIRFGAGDGLLVDLLIKLKKDEVLDLYIEDRFEVLKVYDIIWRPTPEQSNLDF